MISLQEFSLQELTDKVVEMKQPKFRAKQLFDMAVKNKEYDEVSNLPKSLIDVVSKEYSATAVKIHKEFCSKDGTKKYLYELADGNIIEGVYMPHGYGDTLCVSTQVGCKMGCKFCASGIGGLVRNLTAGEILGQVLLANRLNGGTPEKRAVTNVVLMGSGEPLDNYDNVIKFLKLISAPEGINISLRNVSLSTVGIVDKIRELANSGLAVTMTISLHAPTNAKRDELVPMNSKHNVIAIMSAAKYYFEKTRRRLIFEYAMVDGVNSDEESAKELARLVRGVCCHINIIRLNYVKEKGLPPADRETVARFVEILEENNVSVTIRRSMGNDIDGACGQLRRKHIGG